MRLLEALLIILVAWVLCASPAILFGLVWALTR